MKKKTFYLSSVGFSAILNSLEKRFLSSWVRALTLKCFIKKFQGLNVILGISSISV